MDAPAPVADRPAAPAQATLHGLTVDVEDWFHVLEVPGSPGPERWAALEARVAPNTLRLLDLFDARRVRATFFCLGWVAQTCPDLIGEIARRGHEIGSHGHLHAVTAELGPDGFARDLDRSLEAIERACGRTARAFRAPGFSIGDGEVWAFALLASRGITLDASLFLSARAHGGIRLARRRPFDLVGADGRRIVEVPTVPRRIGGRDLAFAGGGYLRLLPWPLLRDCFDRADAAGEPAVTYLHPREVDPRQPRLSLPPWRRFKYYVGIESALPKLDRLLSRYRFGPLSEVAAAAPRDRPVHLPAPG